MALLTAEDILNKKFAATKFREGYDVAELSRADASSAVAAPPVVEAPKPAPEPEAAPVSPISQAVVAKNAAEPESATGMLQLAQKLHDDYVRSGQEEGDRLIAEAKEEGSRIVREAEETSHRTLSQLEQERSLLERKIDELRLFERDYRTRLKSYLQNLLGDLDNRGSALPPRSNVGGSGRSSDLASGI